MRAVEDEGWDEEIEGRRGARNWEGKQIKTRRYEGIHIYSWIDGDAR
jgi:hypothetical protein